MYNPLIKSGKVDMVLLFTPFPSCTKKTSENVRLLVVEELEKLGIGSVNLKKLFITTDEGSNLARLGGSSIKSACLI
uniref:Uncharacterized protein n=1 Tax=Ditylenchus dipsaci TaxID=166011 RepID=A0A915EFZ7_9BILA